MTASITPSTSTAATLSWVQLEQDHALVLIRGGIDDAFLVRFRQHLTDLLEIGVRYVVLDVGDVTSCPSQTVTELAEACRQLHARRGWLRSIATSPCVAAALDAATMIDLFPIYQAARTEFRTAS